MTWCEPLDSWQFWQQTLGSAVGLLDMLRCVLIPVSFFCEFQSLYNPRCGTCAKVDCCFLHRLVDYGCSWHLGQYSAGVSGGKNHFHVHQLIYSKIASKQHMLNFDLQPRSQGTTKKSWWDPEGDISYRGVLHSNIFVMRMLYLTLGWTIVQWFGSCYMHIFLKCSGLGIQGYSTLTFEEYILWLNSRWLQSGPLFFDVMLL